MRQKYSDEVKNAAISLRNEGRSYQEIRDALAESHGVDPTDITIGNWCRENQDCMVQDACAVIRKKAGYMDDQHWEEFRLSLADVRTKALEEVKQRQAKMQLAKAESMTTGLGEDELTILLASVQNKLKKAS